jgi:hypothetical protein
LIDAAIQETLRSIQRAEATGSMDFLRLVDKLRQDVVLAVAQSEISPYTMGQVKAQITGILETYQSRFGDLLSTNQHRLFIKGLQLVDRAVGGADLRLAVPYLSEQTLGQVQRYGAELITGLMDYARQRISSEVSLAVLGQKPVEDVIKAIGRNLDDASVFGTVAARADIIFRTEVNRISNLATVERINQAKGQIPDLQGRTGVRNRRPTRPDASRGGSG